ncbi:hypothetical protein FDA94_29960 [Herbidospora galbida]|uniref:Uncharacterized protein n=1 Tax=Herbidospora galbida TaxID=2575442 RepID=A0A4U3M647_9ACTN|nr:hypothetical protein [Herbidospora galbida]TKK84365.1 hypothetical protein FDA94_29960 [Herbidospora galbida]
MAVIDVTNSSDDWLACWLEPLGEDRWMRPGETFRFRNDYDGDERALIVVYEKEPDGIGHIAVWVEKGDIYAEVTTADGTAVDCGHRAEAQESSSVARRIMTDISERSGHNPPASS